MVCRWVGQVKSFCMVWFGLKVSELNPFKCEKEEVKWSQSVAKVGIELIG